MTDIRQDLLNAEVGVLGCLLIDPGHTAGQIMAALTDDDFITAQYRMIFQAARKIFQSGEALDAITVNAALGGNSADLLMQIMDVTPTAANMQGYIDLLKRTSMLHKLRQIGLDLSGADDAEQCQQALSSAQLLLAERPGVKASNMEQALARFYEIHDPNYQPDYLSWSFDELDGAIHVRPGSMIVLGGYPSDGKTSLAARFALHMARKKRVGFFSYETSVEALFDRVLSMFASVELAKIQLNTLTQEHWDSIGALSKRLCASNLEIIEASGMTVSQIRARALARRYDVIFIDYLQKIAPEQTLRYASSFEAVSQISSDLQQLGRQTKISIVALSQFSRPDKSKSGTVQPPSLSSLRQSGQIEQDADIVMLLYREEPDSPKSRRILRIAKNKDGEANVGIFLNFDGPTQQFKLSALQQPKQRPGKKQQAPADTPRAGTFIPAPDEPIPEQFAEPQYEQGEIPF